MIFDWELLRRVRFWLILAGKEASSVHGEKKEFFFIHSHYYRVFVCLVRNSQENCGSVAAWAPMCAVMNGFARVLRSHNVFIVQEKY